MFEKSGVMSREILSNQGILRIAIHCNAEISQVQCTKCTDFNVRRGEDYPWELPSQQTMKLNQLGRRCSNTKLFILTTKSICIKFYIRNGISITMA